jgi:hypothetical protein
MKAPLVIGCLLSGFAVVHAQIGAQGLGGVGGQQGGVFTIPRVEAHTLGIPGVSRPMMMAGPVAAGGLGMGGGGGFGGQGGMQPNPNWIGAAAMFMPQLLTGQGQGGINGAGNPGAAGGGPTLQTRTFGSNGSAPRTDVSQAVPKPGTRPGAVIAAARSVPVTLPPPDPSKADERLLRHQRDQAAIGSPSAQLALGRRFLKGEGVEANPKVARVWLEAAARNGAEEARAELAGLKD